MPNHKSESKVDGQMAQALAGTFREIQGDEVMKAWILFTCLWILIMMACVEIKNKETRAEVKEALELVKKANAMCKETK